MVHVVWSHYSLTKCTKTTVWNQFSIEHGDSVYHSLFVTLKSKKTSRTSHCFMRIVVDTIYLREIGFQCFSFRTSVLHTPRGAAYAQMWWKSACGTTSTHVILYPKHFLIKRSTRAQYTSLPSLRHEFYCFSEGVKMFLRPRKGAKTTLTLHLPSSSVFCTAMLQALQ